MKNIIKKWLGISEIEDVLTAPEKKQSPPYYPGRQMFAEPKPYVGGELDLLGDKIDELKEELEKKFGHLVECHGCGVLVRLKHAKAVAALTRDLDTSDCLMPFHLMVASHMLSNDPEYKQPSQTVYFCKMCPPEIPKKETV